MDKIERYQKYIKQILSKYAELSPGSDTVKPHLFLIIK
jgi:hypothetical protein